MKSHFASAVLAIAGGSSTVLSSSSHSNTNHFRSPRDIASAIQHPSSNAAWGFSIASAGRSWADAQKKAEEIVAQMTIVEKLNITTGIGYDPLPQHCIGSTGAVPRLGIREICYMDGPVGPRPLEGVTAWPAGVTTASTWDRDLIYARSVGIGKQFLGKGIDVGFGPVAGGPLGRSALDGRNWEGWSPDPYLTGVAAYSAVKGLQEYGVIACTKHFILYEQETARLPSLPTAPAPNDLAVNSIADDRTIHELYLWPFAEAIRAGTGSIMCSCNRVNGKYACEQNSTLTTILRDELQFPGYVVSDWGCTYDTVPAALGGLDVELPGAGNQTGLVLFSSVLGPKLHDAINNGSVPLSKLDEMVVHLLTPWYKFGHDSATYPDPNFNQNGLSLFQSGNDFVNVQEPSNKDLALQIATDGIVLLKNTKNTLPLKAPKSIGVFGSDAGQPPDGPFGCPVYNDATGWCASTSSNNGTNYMGTGSGWIRPPYVIDPLSAIQARAREDATWVISDQSDFDVNNAYTKIGSFAGTVEKCLVFVQARAGEAWDRPNATLWDAGDDLIDLVASNCNDTIVVMHVPGQVDMKKWIDNKNVTAVINAGLPGQESGNAIVQVLYGDVSPSGKLVYTIAEDPDDYIPIKAEPPTEPVSNFTEGNGIDYMYFDRTKKSVLFEFGFGLSYTTFSYSSLSVSYTSGTYSPTVFDNPSTSKVGGPPTDFEYVLNVKATVKNTGSVSGKEVAQLYVSFPDGAGMPPKLLRGFEKTALLAPGKSTQVSLPLRRKDLSTWDAASKTWKIPAGSFTLSVCQSSRKCSLTKKVSYASGKFTV